MKISTTHQEFAELLENQRALDHPEEFLGPNWKDVLNFWLFIDTLTEEQRKSISDAYYSLSSDERRFAAGAAFDAVIEATEADVLYSVHDSIEDFSYINATCELIGSHILQKQNKSLIFLPLFLNP